MPFLWELSLESMWDLPFIARQPLNPGWTRSKKRQKLGIPKDCDICSLEIGANAIVAATMAQTHDYPLRTYFLELQQPAIDRSDRLVETYAQLIEPGRHMFFQCCQGQLGTPHAIRIFQTGKG